MSLGIPVLYHTANKLIASDFAPRSVVLLMPAFSSVLMPTLCSAWLPRESIFTYIHIYKLSQQLCQGDGCAEEGSEERDDKEEEEGDPRGLHYNKGEAEALYCSHFYTKINHLFIKISAFPYGPKGNQTQRHRDDVSKITG